MRPQLYHQKLKHTKKEADLCYEVNFLCIYQVSTRKPSTFRWHQDSPQEQLPACQGCF